MHASTRAIDLNGPADACLPRARERRTRHAGAATPVEVDRGVDLALVADVRAESRWCAKRVHSGLAHRVEHALFAVMLAATAYLYLGVFLRQAI